MPELVMDFSEQWMISSQGTEVKAITYSAMQVWDKEKPEIFVIIDIW